MTRWLSWAVATAGFDAGCVTSARIRCPRCRRCRDLQTPTDNLATSWISLRAAFGQWEYLVERHFPLAEANADERQLLADIDADDASRLIEAGDADAVVGPQSCASRLQCRFFGGGPIEFFHFSCIFLALSLCLVFGREGGGPRTLGVRFQLLEPLQFGRAFLLAAQVALRAPEEIARQFESSGDLERIAHTVLAH